MMPYRESDPNASMSNRRTLFAIACLGMAMLLYKLAGPRDVFGG